MKRVIYAELNGKQYPLCCSLGALEEIQQEFGGIEKFQDLTMKDNDIRTYIRAFEILMKYGAARVKRYENKDIELISHEEIMEDLNLEDLGTISTSVWNAINVSDKNEVAGKSTSKKKDEE